MDKNVCDFMAFKNFYEIMESESSRNLNRVSCSRISFSCSFLQVIVGRLHI